MFYRVGRAAPHPCSRQVLLRFLESTTRFRVVSILHEYRLLSVLTGSAARPWAFDLWKQHLEYCLLVILKTGGRDGSTHGYHNDDRHSGLPV